MLYGLYVSAAGMQAQEYRLSVHANNLANANTTGFKRDLAMIQQRRNPVEEIGSLGAFRDGVRAKQGGGVLAHPTVMDLTQSTLQQTGSPFDAAIEGSGFFVVKGEGEKFLLTRDGRFVRNAQGVLASSVTGRPVLDAEMKEIPLDAGMPVEISSKGEVKQGGTAVAQLAVMNPHARDLVKLGGTMMAIRDGAALKPATVDTKIRQGFLEASGVDPMVEMVNLLEGQRAFEANARMISYQDQTLQQLNLIGRIA